MCVCVLAVPRAKVWMPSLQGPQKPQSGHWRPTGWHLQKPQDRCHGQRGDPVGSGVGIFLDSLKFLSFFDVDIFFGGWLRYVKLLMT